MIRVLYEKNSYFLGDNGIYLELHNTKEFKDQDGIKRVVVEIKDEKLKQKIIEFWRGTEFEEDKPEVIKFFE